MELLVLGTILSLV